MDLAKIKALIDLVSRSQVTELELTEGDTTLRLSRSTAPPSQPRAEPAPPIPPPAADAPPPPEAPPFRVAGRCRAFALLRGLPPRAGPRCAALRDGRGRGGGGQTLCLIEAMKVFTPIAAPQAGTVEAILAAAGEEVEAGQALFRLRA